jgi:hypothetical protein
MIGGLIATARPGRTMGDPLYLSSFFATTPFPFFFLVHLKSAPPPPHQPPPPPAAGRRPRRRAAPPTSHSFRTTSPFLNPPFLAPAATTAQVGGALAARPSAWRLQPAPTSSTPSPPCCLVSTRFAVHHLPPPLALPGRHPPPPRRAAPPPPAVPPTKQPHRRSSFLPGHPSRFSAICKLPQPRTPES